MEPMSRGRHLHKWASGRLWLVHTRYRVWKVLEVLYVLMVGTEGMKVSVHQQRGQNGMQKLYDQRAGPE